MKRDGLMSWMMACAGFCLLTAAAPAQQDENRAERPSAEGKAALAAAAESAAQAKGKAKDERVRILKAAAEQYREVGEAFATESPVVARAFYASGELWRRCSELESAAADYRQCLASNDQGFRERALFGLAQMERRLGEMDAAIGHYRDCAGVRPDSSRATDARIWVAKCLLAQEQEQPALDAFAKAVEQAGNTRLKLRASEALCRALLGLDRLADAAAALSRVEPEVLAAIKAGGRGADSLRKAWERSPARRQLQKAQDRARGAQGDAVRLDAARRAKSESYLMPMP